MPSALDLPLMTIPAVLPALAPIISAPAMAMFLAASSPVILPVAYWYAE